MNLKQILQSVSAVALLSFLVACGGGGGSAAPTTQTPSPQPAGITVTTALQAPSASATIQQDLSVAAVTFNWQASASVALKCGSTVIATSATGPATANLPVGATSCQLFDPATGAALGSAVTVNATCVEGTLALNGAGTCKKILRYKDVVYAIWGKDGTPSQVTKFGAVAAKNMTKYSVIYFCGLKAPNALGYIGLSCQESPSTMQLKLYIDPITNEIHEDEGAPVRSEYVFSATIDATTPNLATKAKVSDGLYFTTNSSLSRIDFQLDATGQVTVAAEGTFETLGTVRYMQAFSN